MSGGGGNVALLSRLCLRAVGNPKCNPEVTFATDDGSASRLVRALSKRPCCLGDEDITPHTGSVTDTNTNTGTEIGIADIPLIRQEYGSGVSRNRRNANDVDMSAPWISCQMFWSTSRGGGKSKTGVSGGRDNESFVKNNDENDDDDDNDPVQHRVLVIENSNPGLDLFQSFIDALADLGQLDDTRLGPLFWNAWRQCAQISSSSSTKTTSSSTQLTARPKKKRKRRRFHDGSGFNEETVSPEAAPKSNDPSLDTTTTTTEDTNTTKHTPVMAAVSALSLANCANVGAHTFRSMRDSHAGDCLRVLDLSGVFSLTDELFASLVVPHCPHLERLNLKNCRRITGKSIRAIESGLFHLKAIDVGGSFNIVPEDMVHLTQCETIQLEEFHASGLGWTDNHLEACRLLPKRLVAASFGFSQHLTAEGLRKGLNLGLDHPGDGVTDGPNLPNHKSNLTRLALHFCTCVDNDVLAELGRSCPNLVVLDVRGCNRVNSLVPFLDARFGVSSGGGYEESEYDERSNRNHRNKSHHYPINAVQTKTPPLKQKITILSRYSNISNASLEEADRLYPNLLDCIIDGGGTGAGVRR